MSETYHFSLPELGCVMCVAPIEACLSGAQKNLHIQTFEIDHEEKNVTIVMEDVPHSGEELFKSVVGLLNGIGVACSKESSVKKLSRRHWLLSVVGLSVGAFVLMLSLVMNTLPLSVMVAIAAVSTPLTVFLGAESYKKFFKSIDFDMDTLFALSTLTAIIVSLAAFIFPGLPMMFDVGLLIFGFRHLGLAIEASLKQIIGAKTTFKSRLPELVLRDTEERVALDKIQVNDRLLIQPGDMIPLDGHSDTSALIVQADFTGNTEPHLLACGEPLLAGMIYKGPVPLYLIVTATVDNSALAKLDLEIAKALKQKAPLEEATKKILHYFIPVVMGVAFLSAVLVSCFFSPMLGIQCAVAVLVSACPCTLSLITPLAIKIGMKKAADHGVLFKSAKKMEEAAGIDVVFFDLNGTLTSSSPFVRDYGVLSDAVSKDEFFFLANLLEKDAPHGVAKVICDYINNNSPHTFLPPPNMVPEAFSRHGVAASIDGVRYEIGNQEMMNQAGITVPNSLNEWGQNKPLIQGDSVIYLARLDKLIGYFIINDPLRKDAIDVVNHLKASGKDVYLCTGADMATASRYGAALGIEPDHIKSQRAPAKSISQKQQAGDKMSDIKDFQSAGHRVAMVGDGSNDSCAVPASDFGIVVQSRCITDAVTQDNAGVVISGQSLWSVVLALTVAEQTVNNIKQNLLFSLLYNVGAMLVSGGLLLTLGVMVNPSIGAGLMILQSSLLLLNAYRFKQQPLPERPVKSADLVSIQKASIKSAPLRFFTPTPSSRVPRGISIDEHGAMKEEIPRGPFQLALSFS